MANKFKAGMTNFIEVLNQMWDSFAAGPYNSVPLTGGVMTGSLTTTELISPKISCTGLSETRILNVGPVGAGNTGYNVVAIANPSANTYMFGMLNGAAFFYQTGSYGITGISAMDINKNATNNRSISAGGTINASGADYAEYLIKGLLCGTLAPGQIVGIDADGRLTDKWDRAITFMVKSTDPCMVGGDSWAESLGPRQAPPHRTLPSEDGTGGDTDAEWAEKQAAHAAAEAQYNAALEVLRQTVDRIAFAGQVPVNLQGATPGQFIVPVQDGEGIAGLAVDEADITLQQYMRAIGRVIAIEGDGRARIIVKVA